MENPVYARINRLLKIIGPAGRLNMRRALALAGFTGSMAALWWFGAIGPEALLGLTVFGVIWGGDLGPGSDEPPGPGGEVDWVKLLGDLLSSYAPGPSEEFSWTPPPPLSWLPSIGLELSRWSTSFPGPMETERAFREESERVDRRFKEAVGRLALDPRRAVEDYFRSLSPPPVLRFEAASPRWSAGEETFTQRLERLAREPVPREETFTERLERFAREEAEGTPDFRTEGERRRDARQAAARRKLPEREPSPVEKLLALVEAEQRRKAAQFPETDPVSAVELARTGSISSEELQRHLTSRQLMKEEVYRRFGSYWKDMTQHPPKSVEEAGKLFEKHFENLGIKGKFEGSKFVYRDKREEMVAEFHGEIVSGIHSFDNDGNVSMVIPPQAGLGVVGSIFPPSRERATLIVGSRIWGVGEIIPQDPLEDLGIYIAVGRYRSPIPVPVTISFPAEPDETFLELQQILGGLF